MAASRSRPKVWRSLPLTRASQRTRDERSFGTTPWYRGKTNVLDSEPTTLVRVDRRLRKLDNATPSLAASQVAACVSVAKPLLYAAPCRLCATQERPAWQLTPRYLLTMWLHQNTGTVEDGTVTASKRASYKAHGAKTVMSHQTCHNELTQVILNS